MTELPFIGCLFYILFLTLLYVQYNRPNTVEVVSSEKRFSMLSKACYQPCLKFSIPCVQYFSRSPHVSKQCLHSNQRENACGQALPK